MSKHLRFKNVLGMVALVAVLGMSWGQASAQNLSSEKEMKTFALDGYAGVIDQANRTITVTVPFGTNVSAMVASFTSSDFSNVFVGANPTVGTLATSGVGPATDYSGGPVVWTVEAENHSFDNYTVTVVFEPPATGKDMLSFSGDYLKALGTACAGVTNPMPGNAAGQFAGTAVTINVPYNSDLTAITVNLTVSTLATCSPADGAVVDFSGGPVVFTVTAQDGSTQDYTVTAVVGPASNDDFLLSFDVPGANSVTINHANQTIAVELPYNIPVGGVLPEWGISDFAMMFDAYMTVPGFKEICSGVDDVASMTSYNAAAGTAEFWIASEDGNDWSMYEVTFTNAAPTADKDLLTLDAEFVKAWGTCGQSETDVVVANISGTDVTVNLPYDNGSLTVTIDAFTHNGASASVAAGDPLTDGMTITITAEDGSTKGYNVKFEYGTASNAKMLDTYGFYMATNNGAGYTNWSMDYPGTIDQTTLRVTVYVAHDTDLHDLIAYFTGSLYAEVFIAESNMTLTPQCSDSDVSINDHSNSLTYVVKAEDGTEERYDVTVMKETALDGNELIGFQILDLPFCLSAMGTYNVAGVYDGMNVTVSVKYGTDVTALDASFTVSDGASVSPGAGVMDFTNPVVYTVTAQNGDVAMYTVTVVVRDQNSGKQLKSYWFDKADNGGFVGNVVGNINETAKTVHLWIPWENRGDITTLVARFTLSDGAVMTRSEDTQYIQTSGVDDNDFTTPVAYTVWAEDCSSVEYFVTVYITPNTDTGISAFEFSYSDCGCDLVNKIDPYAKRIYITLPSTVDISNLAPSSIVIDPDATIDPLASKKQNWTTGSKMYKVTGPADPQTGEKASTMWEVIVENPACQETDILDWTFAGGVQIGAADIDEDNHTVNILLKKGTNLKNMSASIYLSCGATICCNMGACAGSSIDFSDDLCHTCVVTAQDESVTQDWTICVEIEDLTDPEVTTWSVMAYNCEDSVAVQSNEWGHVFIVHESEVNVDACNCNYDLSDFSDHGSVEALVDSRMGAYAVVDTLNGPVYIMTHGLYSGAYYAFAVDEAGNVSCVSKQKLFLDYCDVDVATLCDLRGMPPVWKYTLLEEVVVTYEETVSGGNIKYAQTADCGIKIVDSNGGLATTYGVGAGLTNLKGHVSNDGCNVIFTPVCCYDPVKSSTGNVVAPIELTYDEFYAQAYRGSQAFESMLVRITTPMIAFDDYGLGYTTWQQDGYDLATINAVGDYDWFVNKTLKGNHIGEEIPTDPTIYQGIRQDVNWGACYGLIAPRSKADIIKVTSGSLVATPDPVEIMGILPTQCGTAYIDVINEGVGNLNITALYLDDAAGTDEFELVAPPQVPFVLGTWADFTVRVDFCPLDNGDESTTLMVEYGDGMVMEIPINGTTAQIFDMDYCENFDDWSFGEWIGQGWTSPHVPGYSLSVYPTSYMGWTATPDGSPGLFLRNRHRVAGVRVPIEVKTPGVVVTGTDPVITWDEIAHSAFNGTGTNSSPRNLYISTDGITWTLVDSYLTSSMPDRAVNPADNFRKKTYSLAAYVGKTIWWKFELISSNNEYIYWVLDNVCVQERVTMPIFKHAPDPMDFGGVQVNESATQTMHISNVGVSVLPVHSVELVDATGYFSVTDENTYPVEVTDGAYAFAKNGTDDLMVDVTFAPLDIGVHTAFLRVTYGMYNQTVVDLPILGEGLSCFTAAEAVLGDNWAASQNSWFTYTAEKFQMAWITSCHENQDVSDTREYAYDTWLYIYADCEGNEIGNNDDLEWDACPYNRASSGMLVPMNEGETIKIFWPWAFTSAHDDEGFFFTISATYPIDGDVCETAIPLTLPVVNHFGTTTGFEDDYDLSPCSPYSNYMDGNDKVYSINLEYDGYLTGNILGAYGSIHVLDRCPVEELQKNNCKGFVGGPMGGEFTKRIAAGEYYVIVSTWAPPQTVDFLLNMRFQGLGVEESALVSSLSVYPNPTNGKFTVSIANAEATDMTVELVNISGQVVYRNEVKAVYSYNEDIDASEFAKGVYYLKVNNGEEVKVEKIVVQ